MMSSDSAASDTDLDVPPMDREAPTDLVHTAFALGCFWGPDSRFGALDGVVRTCVGYAGGTTDTPTYEDIGDHIETVRLAYDPDQITYTDLLDHFWAYHDPTRAPFKRQYQPALFPYTDEQAEEARASKADVADRLDDPISTDLILNPSFTRAEAYHQKYKLRHHTVLLHPFRAMYSEEQAFTDSPAAALVNGYVGGHRPPARLKDDVPRLGLPSDAIDTLRRLAQRHHGWANYVHSEQPE